MLELKKLSAPLKAVSIILISFTLFNCGGGGSSSGSLNQGGGSVISGGNDNTNVNTGTPPSFKEYTGSMPPETDDVQNFRVHLWSRIADDDRCGACHGVGTDYPFVQDGDINAAYNAIMPYVSLSQPSQSALISKVADGHNCWHLSSGGLLNDCRIDLTNYISAWAASSAPTSFLSALNQFAPAERDISSGLQFYTDVADANYTTLHNVVTQYCSTCHVPPVQSPFFAVSNPQDSYQAIQSRIDINNPQQSSIYRRLAVESHQCWSGDCAADSAVILSAIQELSFLNATLSPTVSGGASKAQIISEDGFVLSNGSRVEDGAVGLWKFKPIDPNNPGSVARNEGRVNDRNGNPINMDLVFSGDIEWWPSGGVRINSGRLVADSTNSAFVQALQDTGEYSIEAWVIPQDVVQGEDADMPASIVSYSFDVGHRNFMLSQRAYSYDFYHRGSDDDDGVNGGTVFTTPNGDEIAQASLQHVVATFSATTGRKIYVNGELIVEENATDPGNLGEWSNDFLLVVGGEFSGNRQWLGSVRLLAVHNKALSQEDVQTNFDIGVGDKYYTMFPVNHITGIEGTYVVFQVEELDNYSYLFNNPIFYSADETVNFDFRLSGMRIGINTREASSGQAYVTLDQQVSSSGANFITEAGFGGMQVLSTIGTIVPKENGLEGDEFFLTFDYMGDDLLTSRVAIDYPIPVVEPDDDTEQSDIGIKTFAEINASLSALTGIEPTNANLDGLYDVVKQQMPVSADINGFAAPIQMAISQLTVKYCDVLISDAGARSAFFPSFNFAATSHSSAFGASGKSALIEPLLDSLLANTVNITSQPAGHPAGQPLFADTSAELSTLIDTLESNCNNDGSCTDNNARVLNVATATCAAAFGSAMMLIQ